MSKGITTKIIKSIAYMTAKHYANVNCPLITYQPKMNPGIKKLRKF